MRNVPEARGRFRAFASKAAYRRALTIGGSLVGAVAVSAAFAIPAGATLTAPANSTIVGSGSSTTYNMMQAMDVLFNDSPGCQQFVAFPSAATPQPLDYSCTTPPTVAANPENPYNDMATEEAPLGSSNGIQQLEDQGAHGAGATSEGDPINVADNQSFARSSRALKSTDLEGMNFVAYAEDGVTWFHYLKAKAKPTSTTTTNTPSETIKTLTLAQLEGIWNGTYTNWNQVGSKTSAPIVVFSAQEGSGTQSTWKTFLGFDPSAATNQVNCFTPTGGSKTCVGPAVIFENEDAQIAPSAFVSSQAAFVGKTNPDWSGKAASLGEIESDAIFFYSYGKYTVQCKVKTQCGGSTLPSGTTNGLGEINGVAASEKTILEGSFPDNRYLYNVYSNGFNSNLPAATAATLNYVSEIGFICNPNKGASTAVVDPNTGATYLSEIQAIIEAAGFFPLSGGASTGTVNTTPIDEGTLAHPASALLAGTGGTGGGLYGYPQYKAYDAFATTGANSDPSGFCLTTSTDSNSGT
jgi:ABC-type phosphate transport system substrate-binding protein